MSQPPTEQQLDEIAGRAAGLYEYATVADPEVQAALDDLAGIDAPALIAEIRRLRTKTRTLGELAARRESELIARRAELAAVEMLAPQQCPAGRHADWLVDSEYAHACPWCRIADLEGPAVEARAALAALCYDLEDPGSNALGALYLISRVTVGVEAPRDEAAQVLASHEAQVMRRCAEFVRDTYDGQWADDAAATLERDADITEHGCPGYEDAGWGDTPAERRLANCKHCGRPRAVCVAASAPPAAPLDASQPSEVPVEPDTATRAPTGRTGDPRRTLTPNEYDAAWHAVEGAAGEEGADPGTVLHAVLDRLGIEWQDAARTV